MSWRYGGRLARVVCPPADPPETDDVSLEALVKRSQLGDRHAFGALYDRLAPTLLGVAARFLRARREADDLVHDVFLEAWQHICDYDPNKSSVRTWFLLRLRSRALDSLAKAETRRTRLAEDEPSVEQSSSPTQDLALEQSVIRAAVQRLEEGVRTVLDHTYFDGLNAREIAERTGLPLGTVKSRLARGLAALEVALREQGGGHD